MNIKNECLNPIALPKQMPGKYKNYRVFRCGKCPACLRQKANELIVRSHEEWQGRNVHFLTFTYRYDTCPIFNVDWYFIDGYKIVESSFISRDTELSFNNVAPWIPVKDEDGNEYRRYMPIMDSRQELIDYNGQIRDCTHISYQYWTVDNRDMQLLIKRFRKRYPDVLKSYIYVPEYGGLTYHPHYHLMAFGLKEEHVIWFRDNWQYGNVDIDYPGKNQKYKNVPIHEQQEKITRYVAKYCNKGKYDCPYISEGLCIKPRRSVSQNFGIPDIEKLKSYLLATNYTHIDNAFFDDDCPPVLDEKMLKVLVSRRKWDINGYNYPVPKYFINKVFRRSITIAFKSNGEPCNFVYRKLSDEMLSHFKSIYKGNGYVFKKVQITSPLQKEIGRYLLADLVDNYDRKCRENTCDSATDMDITALGRSISFEQTDNLKAAELQFKAELEKSIF